jgi:hypothetical protein
MEDKFKGFGPKQSRNLLQGLGLSRFEIPIDSRITKWLNAIGFPLKLTANALQDRNYYNFVSDGFQKLCEACEIMPCVLDAAIFSSFDEGKWTEENVVCAQPARPIMQSAGEGSACSFVGRQSYPLPEQSPVPFDAR